MTENVATIHGLTGQVEISEGRIIMSGRSPDASLAVRGPNVEPLAEGQTHVELAISGEAMQATIELTAAGLDELADALSQLQEDED